MNGQEFATAVQHGANVVFIVVDNGMYGTIRMHQEREYPTRVHGTELKNPDFAAYARAFSGHGETVERTADFEPAFERALAAGKPSIIHVKTDVGGDHLAHHHEQAARAGAWRSRSSTDHELPDCAIVRAGPAASSVGYLP
jgi:thiamine pyrophosphate-dependent acetolactate synthase large subunit-like protein